MKLLVFLFTLGQLSIATAVVNYRNGNYYQEFTDLLVSVAPGTNLGFKRSYNSASTFSGIFGRGWGTTFETTITILPQTIIVKEMGNGKSHIFVPKGTVLEKNLESELNKIKEKNKLKDEAFVAFKTRLLLDPQTLEAEMASVSKGGTASDGDYSNLNDPSQKMKVKGQQVDFWDSEGVQWSFDKNGSLKSWTHPSGLKLTAQYEQNKLSALFSSNLYIQFERTPQGSIKSIKFGPKVATYKVEDGFLKKSVDQSMESYEYDYEQGRLTEISGKGFQEKITYSLSTGEVSSVTDSTGRTTNYKFFSLNQPQLVRRAEIKAPGDVLQIYEYEERIGKQGPYLYRRMIQRGKRKQQVTFDDCCGRPLTVSEGEKKSEFKYNDKGMPISLTEADGTQHAWTWNEKDQLVKYSKPGDDRTYTYDKFGLVLVVSSKKGTLTLKRDPKGNVIESTVQDPKGARKLYRFVYAPDGKGQALVTEKGEKAFLVEKGPGQWEIDSKRPSDLKAKLELMNWLQKYEDMARPPYPQQWMPSF